VESLSLTWNPYLDLGKCDEQNICQSSGYFYEAMAMISHMQVREFPKVSIASFRYNFTFVSVKEEHGDWGITPKNGTSFDLSGQWAGVMGRVSTLTQANVIKLRDFVVL